jgi:hypothetical protein
MDCTVESWLFATITPEFLEAIYLGAIPYCPFSNFTLHLAGA